MTDIMTASPTRARDLPIILIGPDQVSKTTIGLRLAQRLGLPLLHLASLCPSYWAAAGFDASRQAELREADRWGGIYRYQMPFNAYALERALADHSQCVLELAAMQSVYDDPDLLARVQQLLRPSRHGVLLVPSPDVDESLRILAERREQQGRAFWEDVVKHPAHVALAKQVVYTRDRTPAETCVEILQQVDPTASIILIGPVGAGKSTQAQVLAQHLGMPQIPLDHLCWQYNQAARWNIETDQRIAERDGEAGRRRYRERFDLHAVERVLADYPHSIIAFGAFHSMYDDPAHLARARELLARVPNVVLLLPWPDLDQSVRTLRERTRPVINGGPSEQFCLTHRSNRELATYVIDTNGKTPEVVVNEILQRAPALLAMARHGQG